MADIKRVQRLTDWFDALALLGDIAAADAFAADQGLPVVRAAPTEGLDAIAARLRAADARRPLVVAADPAEADLLAAWTEPFKIWLGAASPAADVCDLAADALDAGAAEQVCAAIRAGVAAPKRLNILVLYDDRFTHIETVREHLRSFQAHSRHTYFFFPVPTSPELGSLDEYEGAWPEAFDFTLFDAVVWHFMLPAYLKNRLSAGVAAELARFDGLKILFVQDEYDTTANTWASIRQAGIDVVMTCVPPEGIDYVYPAAENPGVEFLQTLTGFVPEDTGIDRYALPMARREVRLAYRGRPLPYRYGKLAREKYDIGVQVARLAREHGVNADIGVEEADRIYGVDWYRFLGSARAQLATESGSNVFDFDGSLRAASDQAERDGLSFEAFHDAYLKDVDGKVQMNQVSPKIFEAIRLRTALVCFEGVYSGVIQPDLHYIPLKKDYSNIAEVFARLEDVPALEAMTERAFNDVIGSGDYSHAAFVRRFDSIVDSRVARPPRAEIIAAPVVVRRRGQARFEAIVRPTAAEYTLNTGILRPPLVRREFVEMMEAVRDAESHLRRSQAKTPPADAVLVASVGPGAINCFEFWRNAGAEIASVEDGVRITTPPVGFHYAAAFDLDLSRLNFTLEHCWVRVKLREPSGVILASVYDAEANMVRSEAPFVADADGYFHLRVTAPGGSMFMLRTNAEGQSASVVFERADVFVASAVLPHLIAEARGLAATGGSLLPNPLTGEGALPVPTETGFDRPRQARGLPSGAVVVARFGPEAVQCYDVWRQAGASLDRADDGARLTTPQDAYHYAGGVPLQPPQGPAWIRVRLKDVTGRLGLSLYDSAANALHAEQTVGAGGGEQTLVLDLDGATGDLLLARNLSEDGASAATIVSVEVLAEG